MFVQTSRNCVGTMGQTWRSIHRGPMMHCCRGRKLLRREPVGQRRPWPEPWRTSTDSSQLQLIHFTLKIICFYIWELTVACVFVCAALCSPQQGATVNAAQQLYWLECHMAKVWRKGKDIKGKGKFHCSMEVTVRGEERGGWVCGKITESEAGSRREAWKDECLPSSPFTATSCMKVVCLPFP